MSEKAVGSDWKKRIIYTLRHAAGCNKYLSMDKWKKKKPKKAKKNQIKTTQKEVDKTDTVRLQIKTIMRENTEIKIGVVAKKDLSSMVIEEKDLGKKICDYEAFNVEYNDKLVKSGIYYLNK